jgi:hypothetical protein
VKSGLFFAGLVALPVLALCRYTVRDIGFVSLVEAEWVLEATGPLEDQAELRALEALLLDANVMARVQPTSDLAVRWALVSTDGQRLGLGQSNSAHEDLGAARDRCLSEVLDSPLRARLSDTMQDVFATVLLVAGTDQGRVAAAREEIDSSIDLLRQIEPQLPRPLAGDVVVEVLGASERDTERVVLWSLGLHDLDPADSAVVLIYGRMKRAGAPLIGERLITAEILSSLALIGESCECDTDRDWAAEPRLPHRFDVEQHNLAAMTLGFDPASPYVLAEVTRILARGKAERTGTRRTADLGTVLYGYREGEVAGIKSLPVPSETKEGALVISSTSGGEGDWGFDDEQEVPDTPEQEPGLSLFVFILLAFFVVCGVIAVVILILGRKS